MPKIARPGCVAECRARTLAPAQREAHSALDVLERAGQADAFVELHLNVGAEQALDLHRALGRQLVARPVDMRLEYDAALVELAQLGEAHHLKPAGIGEDRVRPAHEFVQAAEPGDPFRAGRQHQMIGVAEHDVRAERAHLARIHRLDRRGGSARHEGGRADRSARRRNRAEPGGAVARADMEGEVFAGFSHGSGLLRGRRGRPALSTRGGRNQTAEIRPVQTNCWSMP